MVFPTLCCARSHLYLERYRCCRIFSFLNYREQEASLFFALLYIGNPLILNLCFSFMTDISSFAFLNLYFLFLLRGIKQNRVSDYGLSSIFLLAAILVRQGSVVFALANICLLLFYWLKKKNSWTILFGLVVLPSVLFVALSHWLMVADRVSDSYIWFHRLHEHFFHLCLRRPLDASFSMLTMLGQVACYYGLYLLPILLPCCLLLASLFLKEVKIAGIWFLLSAVTIATALAKFMMVDKLFMPFNENMLRIPIVGAPNILGISIPKMPMRIRVMLTEWSGFSGLCFLVCFRCWFEPSRGDGCPGC